jgi:hypothetical protein
VINGVRALEEDAMAWVMNSKKNDGVLREGDCVYMGSVRCEVGAGRGGRFLRLLATAQLQREEGPRASLRSCAQARRVQSE